MTTPKQLMSAMGTGSRCRPLSSMSDFTPPPSASRHRVLDALYAPHALRPRSTSRTSGAHYCSYFHATITACAARDDAAATNRAHVHRCILSLHRRQATAIWPRKRAQLLEGRRGDACASPAVLRPRFGAPAPNVGLALEGTTSFYTSPPGVNGLPADLLRRQPADVRHLPVVTRPCGPDESPAGAPASLAATRRDAASARWRRRLRSDDLPRVPDRALPAEAGALSFTTRFRRHPLPTGSPIRAIGAARLPASRQTAATGVAVLTDRVYTALLPYALHPPNAQDRALALRTAFRVAGEDARTGRLIPGTVRVPVNRQRPDDATTSTRRRTPTPTRRRHPRDTARES